MHITPAPRYETIRNTSVAKAGRPPSLTLGAPTKTDASPPRSTHPRDPAALRPGAVGIELRQVLPAVPELGRVVRPLVAGHAKPVERLGARLTVAVALGHLLEAPFRFLEGLPGEPVSAQPQRELGHELFRRQEALDTEMDPSFIVQHDQVRRPHHQIVVHQLATLPNLSSPPRSCN